MQLAACDCDPTTIGCGNVVNDETRAYHCTATTDAHRAVAHIGLHGAIVHRQGAEAARGEGDCRRGGHIGKVAVAEVDGCRLVSGIEDNAAVDIEAVESVAPRVGSGRCPLAQCGDEWLGTRSQTSSPCLSA